jgi:transcription termination/antitermination protein NusG
MSVAKKWLVFYTQSRQEKKVRDLLLRNGHEVFLPMQKVLRQWSDRKKKVEVPLFNSYIFVFESEDKIVNVLQTPGIAWNIRHNDKPAVLHPKELATIQRFLASGLLVEVAPLAGAEVGDLVEIMGGPLKGLQGRIQRSQDGDKLTLSLESIGQSLLVTVQSELLQLV